MNALNEFLLITFIKQRSLLGGRDSGQCCTKVHLLPRALKDFWHCKKAIPSSSRDCQKSGNFLTGQLLSSTTIITLATLVECLPCARIYVKPFTYIFWCSQGFYEIGSIIPILQQRKQSSEQSGYLARHLQADLSDSRTRILMSCRICKHMWKGACKVKNSPATVAITPAGKRERRSRWPPPAKTQRGISLWVGCGLGVAKRSRVPRGSSLPSTTPRYSHLWIGSPFF